MQKVILSFVLASALALPLASQAESWSLKGHACLGPDHNTLVEELDGACKQGDIIATKYPAYFFSVLPMILILIQKRQSYLPKTPAPRLFLTITLSGLRASYLALTMCLL